MREPFARSGSRDKCGEQGKAMPKDSLSITDNRTGKSYELPVENGTIRATDLRQIKTSQDDFGLMA
jgi:citrate synthase